MIKMYCIYSRESIAAMQNNRGKMAAQAGHAYLHAWWDAERLEKELKHKSQYLFSIPEDEYFRLTDAMFAYKNGDDARKIGLVVETTEELRQIYEDYRGFTGTTLVEDCGYTIVEPGTITCVGIGPLRDSEKGDDLRALELLR